MIIFPSFSSCLTGRGVLRCASLCLLRAGRRVECLCSLGVTEDMEWRERCQGHRRRPRRCAGIPGSIAGSLMARGCQGRALWVLSPSGPRYVGGFWFSGPHWRFSANSSWPGADPSVVGCSPAGSLHLLLLAGENLPLGRVLNEPGL